jgi:hypothetical protein
MTTDLRRRVRWQYVHDDLTIDLTTATPSALDALRVQSSPDMPVVDLMRSLVVAVHRVARDGVGEALDVDLDGLLGAISDSEFAALFRRAWAGGAEPGEGSPG